MKISMRISFRSIPFIALFLVFSGFLNNRYTQTFYPSISIEPFSGYNQQWVDSILGQMSLDEKIGQLFMIPAYSNQGATHEADVIRMIKLYKVGGVLFFQGSPMRQAKMTNNLQKNSKIPLLIAIDGEWGLGMRLDSIQNFPRQMMLGAVQDDALIYEMGKEIGRQCNLLGIHINFAPVVDINSNPLNPVINSRSFGEDRFNVTRKALSYIYGMQDLHVVATAKHFPGHGDTHTDSHKVLPIIKQSYARIDSLELYPFREVIKAGVAGIMTAHLNIPALDSSPNSISSLSKEIVGKILRESLKFNGLVFTDALGMHGVADNSQPGHADLKALLAGNDVLLMSQNIPKAIEEIKKAIVNKVLTLEELDTHIKRILIAKSWVGLNKYKAIDLINLKKENFNKNIEMIRRKLTENAITLVKNEGNLLPMKKLDSLKVASISVGNGTYTKFQQRLSDYDNVKHFQIDKNATYANFQALIPQLSKFNVVIVGIHRTNFQASTYGITEQTANFVNQLSKKTKVVLNLFSSPYSLALFQVKQIQSIVLSYEDSPLANDYSAQAIYGGIPFRGKIPASNIPEFPVGTGITMNEHFRLKYSVPEELGIQTESLCSIDSMAQEAIQLGAFPGCEVLAVKDGVVFYNKAFGFRSPDKKDSMKTNDIYDLASVTKVAATLAGLLKMHSDGELDVNAKLSNYLHDLKTSNKKDLVVKDILAHQSRLRPWIPFYYNTLEKDSNGEFKLNSKYYSKTSDSLFCAKVADSMYTTSDYKEFIYKRIVDSRLEKYKRYKYSDLGFYLFQRVIEQKSGLRLDQYVEKNFFAKLGASTTGFNPLDRFEKSQIVPTEDDHRFRNQHLQGYVHDYGAALCNGVAGHAGLFSNANDLAKLFQMYLQKGTYGGEKYFDPSTFDLFNQAHFKKIKNRRGLGFDKPVLTSALKPKHPYMSPRSFGHSGFTGTYVWCDPDQNLVYIFLSNRINPSIQNDIIIECGIRERIYKTLIDAVSGKTPNPLLAQTQK